MPDDAQKSVVSLTTYTPEERRSRIRIYIWTAWLTSFVGGITHLSALSDDQLAHMSVMRWVLTLLVLLLSPAIEGLNAFRAAIDRSTSGPHPDGPADVPGAPSSHPPVPTP